MRRALTVFSFLLVLTAAPPAAAEIAPPWCGTPEPDAAAALPTNPPNNFAHIPYYAIGCTLEDIQSRSNGRMTVEVAGTSATGRVMYKVVINELRTPDQQLAYSRWQLLRAKALDDPQSAQDQLAAYGDLVKVPLYIQGGIHGDEYEGVDANMRTIERLATTPYGSDPQVDAILDGAVVIFNVIQNPDGRVAGTRGNGNGFDLNRDFLTQSQSETKASVSIMQEWLAPDMLDLHGYATPTLIEATTKPHNPSIDYDLWLKWNQARIDANEAAMNAIGKQIQRPINDWCSNASRPPASGICPDGQPPGPAVAEGWDDWGPFYTPMYSQHVGLNGSTVEMCQSTSLCGGRSGALLDQVTISWSTLLYNVENRNELLHDELELYRRGVTGAARPACCPAPFDVANNWMHEYPTAYVIPLGNGQRSDAEANRLVDWLLFNGVEVTTLRHHAKVQGHSVERGSYVVLMDQPHRGLADTALGIGVDISNEIGRLYAPPGAWSHGYLWGADVIPVPAGVPFKAKTTGPIDKPTELEGGAENGRAEYYALEIDSPTAVRVLNGLLGSGVEAKLALESFGSFPAGTVLFPSSSKSRLDAAGSRHGLEFRRVKSVAAPLEDIDRSPRIAVFTNAVDQNTWSLRNLGFEANPVGTTLLNMSPTDPLANYDVIFSSSNYPADNPGNTTARTRLAAFFARGGGYAGGGPNGVAFLRNGAQAPSLTSGDRGGLGRSGIVYWDNTGGSESLITGAYPAQDTAIMDPPAWITGVPAGWDVDARLPLSGFFAAGLWLMDAESAGAPGSPIIVHGPNTAGTSRLAVFVANPLYRADPEREWPALASAMLWADR